MSHLVPQPHTTRNLASAADLRVCPGLQQRVRAPEQPTTRSRFQVARAELICDYYLRLPPTGHAPSNAPPEYVQFAKSVCSAGPLSVDEAVGHATAPPLTDAAGTPPSTVETLGALQAIGLASAVGAVLGGQAGVDVAKGLGAFADVSEEIALAVPGAILGALTGLALAGRVLVHVLPNVVHFG